MPHENLFLKFSRVPEPELMEETEQVEAYANANFEETHDSIVRNLLNHLPPRFIPASVLDLGAGPGDMTGRLLSLFPNSHLTALDGSLSMIAHNKSYVAKHYPNASMEWLSTKLQEFVPVSSYELIFSNSLLHHLSDPFDFWSAIQRSSDENSFLFICDLLRPTSFQLANNLVDVYAIGENEILRKDFFNSLLAAYTLDEVEAMLRTLRLDHKLKLDQISDRHWICYSRQLN